MDIGSMVTGEDNSSQSGFHLDKKQMNQHYWDGYSRELGRNGYSRCSNSIDCTDRILSKCSDPCKGLISRRGMVVGSVQAGKQQITLAY